MKLGLQVGHYSKGSNHLTKKNNFNPLDVAFFHCGVSILSPNLPAADAKNVRRKISEKTKGQLKLDHSFQCTWSKPSTLVIPWDSYNPKLYDNPIAKAKTMIMSQLDSVMNSKTVETESLVIDDLTVTTIDEKNSTQQLHEQQSDAHEQEEIDLNGKPRAVFTLCITRPRSLWEFRAQLRSARALCT